MNIFRIVALACLIVFFLPVAVRAAMYWAGNDTSHWSSADWSSTGVLPEPQAHEAAMVRIYSSRVGRWRGIFATHSWIVVKDRGAKSYQRFDKVGWGSPIRVNGYAPDGRWFGNDIEPVFVADGAEAEKLIPRIRAAVDAYAYKNRGDYHAWPGPNSNTFVASVLAAVPDARAALPPTAIGKDFPTNGHWIGSAPSRTGFQVNFGGYLGATVAWVEGVEFNFMGLVAGLDIRRPGLKIPGYGRIGV
jgi:hypothetical protein